MCLTESTGAALLLGPKVRNEETGVLAHTGKGIWYELNRDTAIPHGLRQLQFVLEQRDREGHADIILSIDRAVLNLGPPPERTDLVIICGNGAAKREMADPRSEERRGGKEGVGTCQSWWGRVQ